MVAFLTAIDDNINLGKEFNLISQFNLAWFAHSKVFACGVVQELFDCHLCAIAEHHGVFCEKPLANFQYVLLCKRVEYSFQKCAQSDSQVSSCRLAIHLE